MKVDTIPRDGVPAQLTIALDGSRGTLGWPQAIAPSSGLSAKALALCGSTPVSAGRLLELFITSSDRVYGPEWGARNFMNFEWRELWTLGRVAERDGVLVLTVKSENP